MNPKHKNTGLDEARKLDNMMNLLDHISSGAAEFSNTGRISGESLEEVERARFNYAKGKPVSASIRRPIANTKAPAEVQQLVEDCENIKRLCETTKNLADQAKQFEKLKGESSPGAMTRAIQALNDSIDRLIEIIENAVSNLWDKCRTLFSKASPKADVVNVDATKPLLPAQSQKSDQQSKLGSLKEKTGSLVDSAKENLSLTEQLKEQMKAQYEGKKKR